MHMSKPYSKKNDTLDLYDNRRMFTGDSCYPLSPLAGFDKCQVSPDDHFIKIYEWNNIMLADIDSTFISDEQVVRYIGQLTKDGHTSGK